MPSRREYITAGAVATTALSGCVGLWGSDVADIHINNDSSVDLTVTTRVTRRADDRQLLDETVVLQGETDEQLGESDESSMTYQDVADESEVEVYVNVADGPEKRTNRSNLGSDSRGLYVEVAPDSISFVITQA